MEGNFTVCMSWCFNGQEKWRCRFGRPTPYKLSPNRNINALTSATLFIFVLAQFTHNLSQPTVTKDMPDSIGTTHDPFKG